MDKSLIFIIFGFLILALCHLPLVLFYKDVKDAKVQIFIDKPTVYVTGAIDLMGIGYLIYSTLQTENIGCFPFYFCLSLGICIYAALSQQAFAFSEKVIYVGSYLGCKKYNIEQLHVLSIEKSTFNTVLIRAEVIGPNFSNKEIILRFSRDNYQKYGAIFQKKMRCPQNTDLCFF